MEIVEGRRARKPVSYAEFAEAALDDDFDDFKPSFKSKTEKVKDRKEKVNGEEQKEDRERRHSKDRHREHKKHKDKDRHREDRDKHRRDRDRHRKRDSRERDERKKREHKERENKSERREDKLSQDSGKGEGSSSSSCDSSGSQTLPDPPAMNTPVTASPLVSPSRRNPKPRLSLEEKLFQRELEAVLELSKVESNQDSHDTPEPKEHTVTTEGTTLDEKQETPPPLNPSSPGHSTEGGSSPTTHKTEAAVEASPSAPEKPSSPRCVGMEVVPMPDTPPPAVPPNADTMEPLPSTSTGKTAKRIRKTVVFKEDSDSDDFDGFTCDFGAQSEESEGSDFMPSPKKKKTKKDLKKAKDTKPPKSSAQKPSSKTSERKRSQPAFAKENTAPTIPATPPPPVNTPTASPKVTTTPAVKASSNTHTPPLAKASTKKSVAKPVNRPLVNMPSSPSSGAPAIGLVKTPFKCPLSTSPNSGHPVVSPGTSAGNRSLHRGTGLRLGLSRRANLKPLHPSAAGRITS